LTPIERPVNFEDIMGMVVRWETKCESCGKKWKRLIALSKETRYGVKDEFGVLHPYMEIWSPGVPPEWVLLPLAGVGHKFFCSVECCEKWLKKTGRSSLANGLMARIPSKGASKLSRKRL
jgi:hypothetical protein